MGDGGRGLVFVCPEKGEGGIGEEKARSRELKRGDGWMRNSAFSGLGACTIPTDKRNNQLNKSSQNCKTL
jgi:hypothetical protein